MGFLKVLYVDIERVNKMRISQVVRLPNASVKFEGELNAQEAEVVIGTGLECLIMAGAFPDVSRQLAEAAPEGDGLAVEGNDTIN